MVFLAAANRTSMVPTIAIVMTSVSQMLVRSTLHGWDLVLATDG